MKHIVIRIQQGVRQRELAGKMVVDVLAFALVMVWGLVN